LNSNQNAPRLRDHAVFDAELPGKSMSARDFKRILGWTRPHRKTALISLALVVTASFLAVLLPVIITRVVIDGLLIQQPRLSASATQAERTGPRLVPADSDHRAGSAVVHVDRGVLALWRAIDTLPNRLPLAPNHTRNNRHVCAARSSA